jgi:hypothetical protein
MKLFIMQFSPVVLAGFLTEDEGSRIRIEGCPASLTEE